MILFKNVEMNNMQTIEFLLSIVNEIDISEKIKTNDYFKLLVFKLPNLMINERFRTIILLDAIEINELVLDIIIYHSSINKKLTKCQKDKKRLLKMRTDKNDRIFYKELLDKLKTIIQPYRYIFNINDIDLYTKNILNLIIEDIYDVFFK